jgi:hypothetical protein
MTKMSGILKVLAFSAVLLIAASSVSVFSVADLGTEEKGMTSDDGKGIIPLEMPLFIAVAEGSEVSGMRAGTNFLDAEAGISAYTNVGEEIDLEKAKAAFRTIEYETDEYIIGSVPLPDYPEYEDVHAYVHKDGWVVTYYLKDKPVGKIIDWKDYSTDEKIIGTKLEDGLSVACNAAGVPIRNIKYYDFRYPNADKLMIVADAQWTEGTDTFNIKLPGDFVFYDRSYSHYAYDSGGSTMEIDGNEISSLVKCPDSSLWQSGQLSPTQLSLDGFHTVSLRHVESSTYGYRGHACAAIALIYREA